MFDTKQMTEMAEKFSEIYKNTGLDPAKFTEAFSKMTPPTMPTIKSNKNGYEIRTKVLEMAQNNVWQDYHAKWGAFEQTVKRDAVTGEVVQQGMSLALIVGLIGGVFPAWNAARRDITEALRSI